MLSLLVNEATAQVWEAAKGLQNTLVSQKFFRWSYSKERDKISVIIPILKQS